MGKLDLILTRQSASAKALGEPAPSDAELEPVFAAAVTAPDHGAIRPWRFFLLRGSARERLADLFVDFLRRRKPDVSEEEVETLRGKPLRAPLIIAVAARVTPDHPKVPPQEQIWSAAQAAQNILLALHGLGWGAVQLSGLHTYDPEVKAAFGLGEEDAIVGFIYVGTPTGEARVKKRPDPKRFVREWRGPVSEDAAAE